MKKKLIALFLTGLLVVGCGKQEAKKEGLSQEKIEQIKSKLGNEVEMDSKKILTKKLKLQELKDEEVAEMIKVYDFNYKQNALNAAKNYKKQAEEKGTELTEKDLKSYLTEEKETTGGFTDDEVTYAISKTDLNNSPLVLKSKDDTWEVKGKFKLKINSVKTTTERNRFTTKKPAKVVYIIYSYENLGYKGKGQDLYIRPALVVDEKGENAETYPLNVEKKVSPTPIGSKTTGQECYGLTNDSKKIKIKFEHNDDSDYNKKYKVTYELDIED